MVTITIYPPQKELWKHVSSILGISSNSWLIMGNLNQILGLDEKKSQSKSSLTRYEIFKKFILSNNLIDLDLQGNKM